jgi:hypothetical protein
MKLPDGPLKRMVAGTVGADSACHAGVIPNLRGIWFQDRELQKISRRGSVFSGKFNVTDDGWGASNRTTQAKRHGSKLLTKNPLTRADPPGYPASVMNTQVTNPPVVEHIETSGSASASWLSSFYYYWFTNPPAALAGRFG